jgi:1-pyrroline-5-carboxylate dehydrogenase
VNEPVRGYLPGSPERASLQAELARQAGDVIEIPCVIGGERVFTGNVREVTMPFAHRHVLARVHFAGPDEVEGAVRAAEAARAAWEAESWETRAAVLLRAAELLAGPWRDRVNAATMLGQAKTVHQAEIDAACELIDFWRFNTHFYREILAEQPVAHSPGTWNRLEWRALDGFVFAVTPFNFTSIGGNLATAPILAGNTVVWKAATTAIASCWRILEVLEAAGLPPGVVNLLHGDGAEVAGPILIRPELGGVHFTGSTGTFNRMWATVAGNLSRYRCYPRMVGETGGKDFIVARTRTRWPWPSSGVATSTRARSAARPAGCTCPGRCGGRCATGWPAPCPRCARGTCATSGTSSARSSTGGPSVGTRPTSRWRARRTWSRAARPTARRAGTSGRPSCGWTTPTTA